MNEGGGAFRMPATRVAIVPRYMHCRGAPAKKTPN